LSARAAARLEYFGFQKVYDYQPGKADWMAFGLPVEGKKAERPTLRDALRTIPTCTPDERIDAIKQRLNDLRICAVVDDKNVVLGLLDEDAWTAPSDAVAKDVMKLAPLTFRPNRPIEKAKEYFDEHQLEKTLVTNPDGQLLGVALRSDVEDLARKG
jgi:Mg/Co/Ni transporter MgtE